MKAAVEHSGEKKPTSELTTVPAYVVGPLYDALEANDRDAISDFFYNQCNRVVEYINSLPPMSRLSKVLQLMHDQIDVLAGAGSSDAEWATTRLSADALFQTCLGPMPANDAPWGIVDLVGHASMQASDAASDILLPIVAQKLTESPTDVLLEADTRAPLGVHLLRMRALAQIGMYQDSSWSVVEPVLERYSNMEFPLFAMVAQIEKENCQLDRELRANGQDPDALSTKSRELLQRQAQYEQVFCAVDMPPGFDLQKTYVRIASDAVASCAANGDVERFIHLHPGVSTDATVIGRELIVDSSSSYAETDYPFLYSTFTLGAIGDKTGLNITQLSLASQRHLFDFMIESGPERYERLEGALDRLSPAEKLYFTEAFLATEFGDDFGDKLLSIAEHIPQEELGRVLADLERARMGARGVMDWYRDVDEHFAEMALPAIAERITDMITTLEVAARHKSLRIDVGPGNDPEVESQFIYTATWEQAAKDLHDLADNLESDGWILNDPETVVSRVVVESDKFARFRLLNSRLGTMVVNVRPYGTLTRGDAQYEVGSFKNGVEAAINKLSNRHDPYGISPTADMRTFSLRFDREGRAPDVAASDRSQRKATNKEGTVAVDVASIWSFGDDNEPATRVGRAIAAGSRLRAEAIGTKDELNHNMLVDQSYGNADVFAELAHKVIAKLDAQAKRTSKKQLATVARTLVQLRDDHQLAA